MLNYNTSVSDATEICSAIPKFHYTGQSGLDWTGPDQTKSADCMVGSGRAHLVEFSYKVHITPRLGQTSTYLIRKL